MHPDYISDSYDFDKKNSLTEFKLVDLYEAIDVACI